MIFWITISQTIAVQNRTWANKVIVKTLFLKPERVHFIKMTNFESKNVYEIHLLHVLLWVNLTVRFISVVHRVCSK